ncbi:MAG: hypothetical protein WC453_03450 [Patescibacteria group bacterium]
MIARLQFHYYIAKISTVNKSSVIRRFIAFVFNFIVPLEPHSYFRYQKIADKIKADQAVISGNNKKILDIGGSLQFFLYLYFIHACKISEYLIWQKNEEDVIDLARSIGLLPASIRSLIRARKVDVERDNPSDIDFDIIFLNDVLEHVIDDNSLIINSARRLRNNGYLSINVPTKLYKEIFGLRMHQAVGHVRDGYSKEDIMKMAPNELKLISHEYYGSQANWLFSFYYQQDNMLKNIIVYLSSLLVFPILKRISSNEQNDKNPSLNLLFQKI